MIDGQYFPPGAMQHFIQLLREESKVRFLDIFHTKNKSPKAINSILTLRVSDSECRKRDAEDKIIKQLATELIKGFGERKEPVLDDFLIIHAYPFIGTRRDLRSRKQEIGMSFYWSIVK